MRIAIPAKALLILWFIAAMYLHHEVGLADNGDFIRSTQWISTGPSGMDAKFPPVGTEDWSRRFVNYWIPFWRLEQRFVMPISSSFLLWWPGVLLNKFVYSSEVLYLPILSFFPKLILFGSLLLLFNWIKTKIQDPIYKTVSIFSLAAPVTLMLTTTDYVAYLNSFYQESASFVFVFVLFISVLLLKQNPSYKYLLCSLGSILFLATVRRANVYWPLLGIPMVFYAWSFAKRIRLRTRIVLIVAITMSFSFASVFITRNEYIQVNRYHSLFYGALTFSDNPYEHLTNLGMSDASQCINISYFSSAGKSCLRKYQHQMSFKNTVTVIAREPAVMIRMLKYVLDNMQDISLNYLGKYSFDDPRSKTSLPLGTNVENRSWSLTTVTTPLNSWSKLKFEFFPTGYALFLVLIVFIIFFIYGLQHIGILHDLSFIGLMFAVACIVDMMVAILGDGKIELMKHIFLSNMLFDMAFIVFLNSVLVYGLEITGKKFKSNSSATMAT